MQTCATCGEKSDNNEFSKDPDDGRKYICDECWNYHAPHYCSVCQQRFYDKDEMSDHFILTKETGDLINVKPGLYKVLRYPFYFGNCVSGFEGFFDNAIEFTKEIYDDGESSGCEMLCKKCLVNMQ